MFTESVVNNVAGIRKMVDEYVNNETPVPNAVKNPNYGYNSTSKKMVARYNEHQEKINLQLGKAERSDARVHDAFRGFIDQSLTTASRVNIQELRSVYPHMADDVQGILNNFKSLKTRTTFYEYKYMHLNMFLIGFVESTQGVLKGFAAEMRNLNQSKDSKHSQIMSELVASMKHLMQDDPSNIDIGVFENIIRGVQGSLKTVEDEFRQKSLALESGAMTAMHSATQPSNSSRPPAPFAPSGRRDT